MKKNKELKFRCSQEFHSTVIFKADQAGMRVSDYLRCVVERDDHVERLNEVISRLEVATQDSRLDEPHDPLLVEILFIVRELLLDRNAQILGRVNQRMDVSFPGRKRF